MLDHMTLTVRDMARSKPFYTALLAPLGYRALMEFEGMCGFGDDKPYLWMRQGEPVTTRQHIAFVARRRADVDAFHAAGIAAGGQDNGPAGLRPDYHASYYAAFVLDPDGNNLEAVNHRDAGARARKAKPRAAARRSAKARGVKARGTAAKKAKKGARRAR